MRHTPTHVRPARQHAAGTPVTAMHLPNGTDKRELILAVAEDLFFQYGFRGTTMDMICAALRMTKPFVYYYFKNKHEIFETITWRAAVACMTAMTFPAEDTRAAHVKLAEGLYRFIAACVATYRAGALAYRDTASQRPQFQAKLRRLGRNFYADLCTLMEEGRASGKLTFEDTELTARAIASVGAFMYAWYTPEGRLPPDAMARTLTSIAFKMVGLRANSRVQRIHSGPNEMKDLTSRSL